MAKTLLPHEVLVKPKSNPDARPFTVAAKAFDAGTYPGCEVVERGAPAKAASPPANDEVAPAAGKKG